MMDLLLCTFTHGQITQLRPDYSTTTTITQLRLLLKFLALPSSVYSIDIVILRQVSIPVP